MDVSTFKNIHFKFVIVPLVSRDWQSVTAIGTRGNQKPAKPYLGQYVIFNSNDPICGIHFGVDSGSLFIE